MGAAADSEPRTGVLVIRAWTEHDGADGLRVRITSTLDVTAPETAVSVAARPEDVLAIVGRWIEEFRAAP